MSFDPFCKSRKLMREGGVGYTATTKTVLLDGVFDTYEFDSLYMFETEILAIDAGDEITINWNGKQYTCVAFEIDGVVGFGNISLVELGDDTGEPFVYSVRSENTIIKSGVFATNDTGSITVTVTTTTETVHTIDKKFLPDMGLPVVEIASGADGSRTELTAEESAMMDALNGGMCIFKFASDGAYSIGVPYVMSYDGVIIYMVLSATGHTEVFNVSGTWGIQAFVNE